MEGMKWIPYITLILVIAGVMLGAGIIAQEQIGDTTEKCINSSFVFSHANGGCINGSSPAVMGSLGGGKDYLNMSDEYYAIFQAEDGVLTLAQQQPTVAIIAVMTVIISIIAGVFVYMKFFA